MRDGAGVTEEEVSEDDGRMGRERGEGMERVWMKDERLV